MRSVSCWKTMIVVYYSHSATFDIGRKNIEKYRGLIIWIACLFWKEGYHTVEVHAPFFLKEMVWKPVFKIKL